MGEYDERAMTQSLSTVDIVLPGNKRTTDVKAECSTICLQCLYMLGEQDHMYIPGDIIIPGLFDVHYQGDNIFTCGDIRLRHGFFNTEVFAFALNYINSGLSSVRLNNVKLGGLLFDGCMNKIRGNTITSGLFNSYFPLEDGLPKYPLDKMMGYFSYDSGTTVDVAESLGYFGVPVISPGATTPILDDKSYFKTFFRTIPSDSLTSKAMAQTAKALDFSYIITLNAPDEGSRDAMEKFRMYAKDAGICIGASYEFVTDGDMNTLISYIEQSSTRVVAVFADPDRYIEELLDAKLADPRVANIVFLSNRHWDGPTLSISRRPLANTAMTFGMDVPRIDELRQYLSSLLPLSYDKNPWFSEAYQAFYECNLPGYWKYVRPCTSFPTLEQSGW